MDTFNHPTDPGAYLRWWQLHYRDAYDRLILYMIFQLSHEYVDLSHLD
jgi:hypothetical protein